MLHRPVESATVFSSDREIGKMREYDFAEHAEETFAFSVDGQVYCVDFSSVNDPTAVLPDDVEIVNLTAGILPAGASASAPTWRPDGSGVAFQAVLNADTTSAEQVIAEIVFGPSNPPDPDDLSGCPDGESVSGSTFNVIATGGTGRRAAWLFQPDYRPNVP